jgi:hypothetical protein
LAVLTTGALCAPLAHAGSYDVLSCSIDGGYHANNAWVAQNNPAGDARYVTDATCPKLNDPLTVTLAAANAFLPGTFAALYFFAPPNTTITNYNEVVHHLTRAPSPDR